MTSLVEGRPQPPRQRAPARRAFTAFARHRLALASSVILTLLVFVAIAAPWLAPHDPYSLAIGADGQIAFTSPPSAAFLLGTDSVGRDVLSRLIYGGRVSLTIGLVAAMVALIVGTVLGVIAGHFGGWVDSAVSRFADAVSTFPALFLILTISSFVPPNIFNVIAIIGLLSWMPTFRLSRAEVLRLRSTDFLEAANALGAGNLRIMVRHLTPNAFGPILVQATLGVAEAILTESALSFLGLGVQPPVSSWGNMLSDARSITVLRSQPWLWLSPGIAIFVTVLSINFLGDGLRDALNPRRTR